MERFFSVHGLELGEELGARALALVVVEPVRAHALQLGPECRKRGLAGDEGMTCVCGT